MAVVGFSSGTIINRLGVRLTLAFGGSGYCLYAISLLVSVHKKVDAFNIFAGAYMGFCAALLWTAQGTIMLSYPLEHRKGHYFSWFWAIFNVGGCIGSLVCENNPSSPGYVKELHCWALVVVANIIYCKGPLGREHQ